MPIEQIRHKVIASIWQALAQSDVNLSSIPQEQQDHLVGKIADSVMITVDGLLNEGAGSAPEEEMADDFSETVIWEGRPFLSLNEYYVLTNDRLKIRRGLLGREIENFELIRIQDIDMDQGISERVLGIGDIHIRGHDASDAEVELRNVSKPELVYETLRKTWLEARKRHGLQFSEFM